MMLALLLMQASVARPHVTISLVPEFTAVVAGMPQQMALRFQVEPGWHIYWRNPGGSGLATTAKWTLPPGFSAGPLEFTTPTRLDIADVVTHVLEGDVVLRTTIRVPGTLSSRDARLAARVSYGVCKDACYPGQAFVSLTMPVMTDAGPNARWRIPDSLHTARRPRSGGLTAGTTFLGDTAVISIPLPAGCTGTSVTFFPWDRDLSPEAVTVPMPRGCGPAVFKLPIREKPKGGIRGVVVVGSDLRGYEISSSK
jgi:DsbC/DsbD-like thiol-disulfide interchange protein